MSEYIDCQIIDNILKLQIKRPKKKNALKSDMYTALVEGLQKADADRSVRVVYMTGSEDSFSSGNDLKDFLQNPPTGEVSPVSQFLYQISHMETPVVAAVNGIAIGVGTTMLLHFDLVYAAESAIFQLPFVNLAVVPEAASSYIMPKLMGYQKSAELLMLGEKFSAAEAKAAGFVNQVIADDELQEFAWERALKLSKKAPEALRLTKMLLKKGDLQTIEETMQAEGQIFKERLGSDESREVMMAFMEKREPNFAEV